ncbi:MAG: ABC transporter transmembrane domain-containing protein, partial [Gemmobacter sp.]
MHRPDAPDESRPKSRRVGALAALAPFLAPYRALIAAAALALVLTAGVSLVLPIAVRRVVDGFGEGAALLDSYFAAALGIAALLAVGTGLRFWLVTRLGERVVADIRRALFDRILGLSPAFYERMMTGEVLSRLTPDTTLVLAVIATSVSVALRNMLILAGGLVLLAFSSAKLTALVLLVVPGVIVPIVVLGRRLRALSRQTQDWIAASSGNAAEALGAVQTVQAFTHEGASRAEFARITEASFDAARRRIATRAAMTVIVIFLVFAGIVGVMWVGARDVRAGVMTPGELVQFVIYAIMVAAAVG